MSSGQWLFDRVNRVPSITDAQIAEMRRIEPVVKVENSVMYRRIKGADTIDPRGVAFNWDVEPVGDEFTYDILNQTTVITQHHSAVFFKPSLAEVYAWIRFYLGDDWPLIHYFWAGDAKRIGSSSDFSCDCILMGGPILVRGREVVFANDEIGYELVRKEETPHAN